MSEFSTPQSGEGIKSMDKPDELIATHDSSSLLSEDQFLCSICLYVFTDPISTPCGHNYCKTCLTRYWDTSNYYQCPLCKETFIKRPELKINTTLREVVGHFKKSRVDNPEILCDVCTDGKLKALKSCLDCGVTFCMKHLEPHSVGKLKKHKLIEPVENLEDYTCQKHDRPLELYCRDDKTSVCLFCTETDHKTHNTVPIEKETSERKLQLTDTQTEVQHMIQQKLKKIENLKHSVELRKRNTEKEIADSAEVFTALMCSIERSQAELLEVMKEKQKAAERQAEGFIKELEQEITRLKKRDTELETVLQQKDHIQFLQNYQTLCAAPHTKNWTGINVDLDLSADTVKDILSKLQKTLNEELSKTISEKLRKIVSSELKRIQQYAVDVVLDPDTAHPHLILSEDGKQVAYGDDGDEKQTLSENPKRFTYYAMILGQEGFSSGKFFYEVQCRPEEDGFLI
ncbi:tripartite motif-containing protein 16-like isoform X2 [Hoplias malabaricus]|uniref:tripartite motif-containing protein 16-like isoform X2 n=1 Tax=Hoplias malabaricus TaxID=27720 RepID=UPI00346216C7